MTVKSYIGYQFSSGCTTGEDYKEFEKLCKKELKSMAKKFGINAHAFHGNHYEWSAVLERNGKFVYVSMSDVRFWNDWYGNILIRTMAHDKDWRGGSNNYCSFNKIGEMADRLLNE